MLNLKLNEPKFKSKFRLKGLNLRAKKGFVMKIAVNISLKNGVLDPQAKAIEKALHSLNFNAVKNVKMSKQIILELDLNDEAKANELARQMCDELLVNSVIEDYTLSSVR